MKSATSIFLAALVAMLFTAATCMADMHSAKFAGPKANTGTVTMAKEGKMIKLTLSDDFVVPDTPDPHWQVVDSKGNAYLLQRLKIKGEKTNKSITLPPYVKNVSKVVIWCAFAESNLGEAVFNKAMK